MGGSTGRFPREARGAGARWGLDWRSVLRSPSWFPTPRNEARSAVRIKVLDVLSFVLLINKQFYEVRVRHGLEPLPVAARAGLVGAARPCRPAASWGQPAGAPGGPAFSAGSVSTFPPSLPAFPPSLPLPPSIPPSGLLSLPHFPPPPFPPSLHLSLPFSFIHSSLPSLPPSLHALGQSCGCVQEGAIPALRKRLAQAFL